MRSLVATLFLLFFAFPAFGAEPIDHDRFVARPWYQPTPFSEHRSYWDNHRHHSQRQRSGKRAHAYAAQSTKRYINVHSETLAGRPAVCPPRAWCGCWASIQRFGHSVRELWLARAWASAGTPATHKTANVAVFAHHVGFIKAHRGDQILLLSGNDGHAVRERWRSARGVIAWRLV